jgi:hypothetical protein
MKSPVEVEKDGSQDAVLTLCVSVLRQRQLFDHPIAHHEFLDVSVMVMGMSSTKRM